MSYTNGLDKSSDYFNTVLYTGNSTDNHTISVGFQPDFTWIKDRGRSGFNHRLQNSVAGATESLQSNRTVSTQTNSDAVKSFNSNGFVLGNDAGNGSFNGSSTFVAWNWLAGGSASSNSNGSITSSVSANTTSGFSIVSYTGTGSASTIGHGLGSAPKMVICKTRSTAGVWLTWHTGIPINGQIQLQSTDAVYNPGTGLYWNSTLPTSSVFSVGTSGSVNGSGTTYIAYCFAEKKGFSKFGSYTGNGNADGTFVYTGFKPAFVLVKATSISGESWQLNDTKRKTFNVNSTSLFPNLSNAESSTAMYVDMLSNGFKIRGTDGGVNQSGGTLIYIAFAENSFVANDSGTAVPGTAR